jgi:hypothetical protein
MPSAVRIEASQLKTLVMIPMTASGMQPGIQAANTPITPTLCVMSSDHPPRISSRFALGQVVATGALDENETSHLLFDTARDLGLGIRECRRTIASGMTARYGAPPGSGRVATTAWSRRSGGFSSPRCRKPNYRRSASKR